MWWRRLSLFSCSLRPWRTFLIPYPEQKHLFIRSSAGLIHLLHFLLLFLVLASWPRPSLALRSRFWYTLTGAFIDFFKDLVGSKQLNGVLGSEPDNTTDEVLDLSPFTSLSLGLLLYKTPAGTDHPTCTNSIGVWTLRLSDLSTRLVGVDQDNRLRLPIEEIADSWITLMFAWRRTPHQSIVNDLLGPLLPFEC